MPIKTSKYNTQCVTFFSLLEPLIMVLVFAAMEIIIYSIWKEKCCPLLITHNFLTITIDFFIKYYKINAITNGITVYSSMILKYNYYHFK